ncbi:MAG TPA: aldo/keto reductase, partial [Terriglobales bacterium]
GMSTHKLPAMLPWVVQRKSFDVVLTVYNFAMGSSMDETIAAVTNAGVGVVAMKVMAGGFRSLKPSDPIYGKLHRDGAMLAALKWVLAKPNIATTIPSMTDMDQLDENLQAMAHPLAPKDEQILARHMEQIRPLYCNMCGECDGMCKHGLQIADTLRVLAYADGYREFALARERFHELPPAQIAARCGDCMECTVQCRHGVQVQARMSRAQELLA